MTPARHIIRAFQWDLARQVERLDFLLTLLPRYAEWGYEELYLHLEDAVEFPSLPAVARPGAYTHAQFTRLVQAAAAAGIRVVPIVNLLGHTQYLIKAPGLRDLNELRDAAGRPLAPGQICPLHPRTPVIAEKLLRDMAPFCTAGKVHVGLDESFHLGQCPRCRAEVARVGLAGHFAAHVNRLHQLTQSLGLRLGLWADMLALLPATIPQLPCDVIAYDWYYYPFARRPRVELHNFAEVDLATPLQARGIEYWGCPMNGAFRYEPMPIFGERLENIRSWWRRCHRVGAGGFLITSWETSRLALELTTVVDAAAACLWLDPGIDDPPAMLRRGFERVLGPRRGAAAARVALAADTHPYSGYHRWQINDRWDVCAGREGVPPYQREETLLAGLSRYALPMPLAASIAFRRYLAQREIFVRRNAQAVFQLRRLLAGHRPSDTITISPSNSALSMVEPAVPAGSSPSGRRAPPERTTSKLDPDLSETLHHARHLLAGLRREADAFAATLRAGRAAARAMWNRSRDPQERGPNELMLGRDADRLREWRLWLKRAGRNPDIIWRATPVCGAWQLQFTLHNFAPALQKVAVEQQLADGSWRTLHALSLMEFRAQAARPRTRIRREFSVPILVSAPKPAIPRSTRWNRPSRQVPARRDGGLHLQWPCLRLAVRGVGQVAVSHVELTNGVVRLRPCGWLPTRKKILGPPAPRRGFPVMDWTKNQDSKRLTFRPSRNSSQGTQSTLSRFRRSLPR
jgi:hypothetical protein